MPLVLVAVPVLVPLVVSEAGSLVLCANALELSLPVVGVEVDNCDEDGDEDGVEDEGEEGLSGKHLLLLRQYLYYFLHYDYQRL